MLSHQVKCKNMQGASTVSTCILRHRRSKLQEVFYKCKSCLKGLRFEFMYGYMVTKKQYVIRDTTRLEIPAWQELNPEMYPTFEPLYKRESFNVVEL